MIQTTSTFRKDYKRENRTQRNLENILTDFLVYLLTYEKIPFLFRDHALTGNMSGYRACHLKPDLVMVYRMPDSETIVLTALGSHSELFKK